LIGRAGFFAYRLTGLSLSDLNDFLSDGIAAAGLAGDCVVTTQETSGPPQAPVIVDVDHDCQGWIDNYSTIDHVDSNVQVNDRKVFVLCASLSIVPEPGNAVTIGDDTFSIINVQRDPASVAWVLQCRV
jgi:hypothetical protein